MPGTGSPGAASLQRQQDRAVWAEVLGFPALWLDPAKPMRAARSG